MDSGRNANKRVHVLMTYDAIQDASRAVFIVPSGRYPSAKYTTTPTIISPSKNPKAPPKRRFKKDVKGIKEKKFQNLSKAQKTTPTSREIIKKTRIKTTILPIPSSPPKINPTLS
ncbi:MAG: hypothetical protein UU08_C0008G0024 [Candidatus Uhrbacteria bacterium GW2011_GWE2_40_58]|nr:MAG: hypothetical protein UT94_C0008G0024 [Candidatus Uhrbacteria bacterium GW2011_GWF2_40_263]KKR67818.1 MAG: hypothetical protein UU08_C0008G0024 [Candidatus Uhrbacteria bacterium GW2011_GWE2_40_58]